MASLACKSPYLTQSLLSSPKRRHLLDSPHLKTTYVTPKKSYRHPPKSKILTILLSTQGAKAEAARAAAAAAAQEQAAEEQAGAETGGEGATEYVPAEYVPEYVAPPTAAPVVEDNGGW